MISRFRNEPPAGLSPLPRRKSRPLAAPLAATLPLAALLASGASPAATPQHDPPRLAALTVSGAAGGFRESGRRLRPNFHPETFHYAIGCDDPEALSVSGAAAGETAAVTLNRTPVPREFEEREVVLRHDQDLVVVVSDGGDSVTYAVHCVSREFPRVRTAVREPGRRDGLLLIDPAEYDDRVNRHVSHIAILDANGVPRFHRRISGLAYNFRWHAAHRMYSYNRKVPPDDISTEVVLLDESLRPVARIEPVGLAHPDHHDFLLTDEGNYLFVVYNPAERDLSPYPAPDGEFPYSTAEPTRDSVIQEVSPEGEVLFQWNSWGNEDGHGPAMRIADCRWGAQWPREYAHLNSLQLVDGDIVASFRGCSQVLKIERPSGRVLWQLGGARPAIPDGRIHYTIVGDPEPEGFCGQHTAIEGPSGVVTLFDNRVLCPGDDREWWRPVSAVQRRRGARVVEYRLEGDEAVFSREYRSIHRSPRAGAVQLLDGGTWLIAWGAGPGNPAVGAVEVDRAGREVFAVSFRGRSRAHLYRAYREYGLRVPLNLPR